MSPPVVVLVGPPGAGKSTTARALAGRLGVTSRDTDEDVERATGMSIPDIFVERGEDHFRALERAAVAEAMAGHDGVLAVGGGAPMDPGSRDVLAAAPVAFLDVSLAVAARRIGLDAPRPLLIDAPRATWKRLMDVRRPVYTGMADVAVDTSGLTPEQTAEKIVDALGLPARAEGSG
jgi:shikimate kinase